TGRGFRSAGRADDRTMARQPPGGWLPGIDSEISPRRNRAYSPTARFMECVAFRTHPFQTQVSSVEQPWAKVTSIDQRRTNQRRMSSGTVKLSGLRLGRAGVVGYLPWMTTPRDPLYAGYRYPAELISYAVWLYFRFPLSLRMVEEMLAARGISVTYETIRQWGLKFGREFANRIRRRAPRRGDKWHLDEVVITIAGKKH